MKQQFTTRIENEIMEKLKLISEAERRTLNNTIEYLLSKAIEVYEEEHGVIQSS